MIEGSVDTLSARLRRHGPFAVSRFALLAGLWLCARPAYALDPNKRITQYLHSAWRTRDDFSSAGAYGITQTADGFLWFTSGDLDTFDGVRFTSWDGPPNGGSISKGGSFGQIVNAFADRAGGLWLLGLRGMVRLKGRTVISEVKLDGLRGLQNFHEDRDGSIWVVRGKIGVSDSPLCHVTGNAAKCFGRADGIPIAPIHSLLADGNGGFWLGGQTALVHWREGASETYPIPALKSNLGQTGIAGLARGPDGSLWIGILAPGRGRGLGRLVDGVFRPFVAPGFDGSKIAAHNLIFDRDGNLWVATAGDGVYRIRGNNVEHYGRAEGLAADRVDALFEDREGNVWTATSGQGRDQFRDPPVASFSTSEGLANSVAQGVLSARDGSVWVANLGALDRIERNGTVSSIRPREGLPGNRVTSLLEDRAGNLWVGADDGLYLMEHGRFRPVTNANAERPGLIAGLTQDAEGDVWAECLSSPPKLVRIHDFRVAEEFSGSRVPTGRAIAADPQGGIWIGTLGGDLALFRNGVVRRFPLNTKGDPAIYRIAATGDGSVLAGSADGLAGVRNGSVRHLSVKNGLPCNFVTSFIEDEHKHWWLYTDCGIVDLPGSELDRWWANPDATVKVRVYDESDGAQAGRPVFNSAARSSDGRVWFAQGNVVQMLDPAGLSRKALPAMTWIQSLTVDRKEVAATGRPRLPAHPRDLQIDYTSPVFSAPRKIKFRYRIDGYDYDWHDAGTRRQAFYTDLPPGDFTFRVIACNVDGVWNDAGASLDFSIAPAYYQTTWFRAAALVAFLAVFQGLYRLRLHQIGREFAAQTEERARIARDLHDTLLQSFQVSLIRMQAARNTFERVPETALQSLDKAITTAAAAVAEGRGAIEDLRAGSAGDADLAQLLTAAGQEVALSETGNSVMFRVTVEGEPRKLQPLLQDEVYRIGRELLRNAFRHAQAGRIEVEIRYENRHLRVHVRDDGKGIEPEILKAGRRAGHWGMPGMRERVSRFDGRLEFWSEAGAGTEALLSVPAAVAYVASGGGPFSFLRRPFSFAGKGKDAS